MFTHETFVRVRYAETDQMRYVYYGNYAQYFEVARVEALRSLGFSYRSIEDSGIFLPVFTYSVKFFKPAFYDEELKIKTMIRELPKARIQFFYETYNEKSEMINTGETTLVFIDRHSGKPCAAPETILRKLKTFF